MEPTAADVLDTIDTRDTHAMHEPTDRFTDVAIADQPGHPGHPGQPEMPEPGEHEPRITRPALTVGASTVHGTGVFAAAAFAVDEVIEECPVLVVVPKHAKKVANTVFGDYVYEWKGGYGLALGYGSLYNHSRTSNARYEMDYDIDEIHIVAVRAIEPGDEITINYNGDPADPSPVWFELDE